MKVVLSKVQHTSSYNFCQNIIGGAFQNTKNEIT